LTFMALPLNPPVPPQLARSRARVPEGDGWAYEPKWDGFRAVAFVDGDDVYLQSRNGKALRRYFPELRFPKGRYVLDGEIVIFGENGVQLFDALGQRIHPAKTRIDMLAEQTPARFIAFDVLARDDTVFLDLPFEQRRAELERTVDAPVDLTPWSHDPADAEPWLRGAEGVIAKELAAPYRPGERTGMVKIKRVRTIDAVVRGWRPARRRARSARSSSPSTATTATCARSATRAASRPRRSARSSTASRRTRPACAGPASRAAGPATASSSGASCARARRRGHVRPRQRRAHPPRREDPALARGQGPARVPARPARQLR
jgi:hypothetical protein